MDEHIQAQPSPKEKKEYTSPQLIEYGDLVKLTQGGIPEAGETLSTFTT